MERPILTLNNAWNFLFKKFQKSTRAFSIVLITKLIVFSLSAQDCNTILSCTDGVQISLDEDCNKVIEPDMILTKPAYSNNAYDISAKLPNGQELPQFSVGFDPNGRPIKRVSINRSHIGMSLEVSASLRGCGNSCWGKAKIEDKLAPVPTECPCEERITFFKDTLSASSPTFISGAMPCNHGIGIARSYTVFQFSPDATGIVDISLTQTNFRFTLYSAPLNLANTCANVVTGGYHTSSFSGSLTANTNYYLVVSFNGVIPVGFMPAINGLFIDSRVGNIKSASDVTVCTLTCENHKTFLAQTAATASTKPGLTDNCSGALWVPTTERAGSITYSGSTFTLVGDTAAAVGPAIAPVLGAQMCFTAPALTTISFDYNAISESAGDPITFTINGTIQGSAVATGIGTRTFNLTASQTFCVRVQSNNMGGSSSIVLNNFSSTAVFPALTLIKKDTVKNLDCSYRFDKIIRRDWIGTDPSGNESVIKSQFYYVERADTSDVNCPADWYRTCEQNNAFPSNMFLPNGRPNPAVTGMMTSTGCSNIQIYYDDVYVPLCGVGFKVLRMWHAIDWCTGAEKTCRQEIKFEDKTGPIITCPVDMVQIRGLDTVNVVGVVTTKPNACNADWIVRKPIVTYDCSKVTWDVEFLLADKFGKPPVGGLYTKLNGTTRVVGSPGAFTHRDSLTMPFRIENLPRGLTWLRYTVTDECGYFTYCFTEIEVVDRSAPFPICEDETVITLDNMGMATMNAKTLDNWSYDNCDGYDLRYEIRRKFNECIGRDSADLKFGPNVKFCCEDANKYIDVVLRVYDKAGNFADCETKVFVKNNLPVSISCANNQVSLMCGNIKIDPWVSGFMPFDTSVFPIPTVSGICGTKNLISRISNRNLDKCGKGTVTRKWMLASDTTIACNQVLTITARPFGNGDITWPTSPLMLPICNLDLADPEDINSMPTVLSKTCRDIGISHEDIVFYDIHGACAKIVRTWRVIDWCTYQNTNSIIEFAQEIKLTGTGGATFTGCQTQRFTADPGKCEKEVTLTVNASDICTDPNDLLYSWSLDIGKNQSVDQTGTTRSVTRTLPAGTHRITFSVTNKCGTTTQCAYDVIIDSNKKPTPVCIKEIVIALDEKGVAEIWANDFNLKSENNCGPQNALRFAFNQAGNQTGIRYTCDSIPNGQTAVKNLRMYVFDASGSFDFCNVNLILQDNVKACPDKLGLLPTISGRILTENKEGLNNTEVVLKNMVNENVNQFMTKNSGDFSFGEINTFDYFTIEAKNDGNILNGVSTLDLVMIQRHILGIQKLNSPYKLIAADINNSKSITAADLISLRKVVLGISNQFENNKSWRIVPNKHTFVDLEFPYDFPERLMLDSVYTTINDLDFTAVKVGDVNNSVVANLNSIETESRSARSMLVLDHKSFEKGETVKIDVRLGEMNTITGMQLGLDFDPAQLELVNVSPGKLALYSGNMNLTSKEKGVVKFSYHDGNGVDVSSDDVLWTLEFKAKSKGTTDNIKLLSSYKAELYDQQISIKPIALTFKGLNTNKYTNTLHQNEPNPFKETSNISFELAEKSKVNLRVMDISGKIVWNHSSDYDKGVHSVQVSNQQIGSAGIYFYQIETGEFSATKKMILIE